MVDRGQLHRHRRCRRHRRARPVVCSCHRDRLRIRQRIGLALFKAAQRVSRPDEGRLRQLRKLSPLRAERIREQRRRYRHAVLRWHICPVSALHAQQDAAVLICPRVRHRHRILLVRRSGARDVPAHIAIVLRVQPLLRQHRLERFRQVARDRLILESDQVLLQFGVKIYVIATVARVDRTLRSARSRGIGVQRGLDRVALQRDAVAFLRGQSHHDVQRFRFRLVQIYDRMCRGTAKGPLNHCVCRSR